MRRDAPGTEGTGAPPLSPFQVADVSADENLENRSHWITQRVQTPMGLQCVLFIPDGLHSTGQARKVLPPNLSYEDTIFNISRAAMLTNCLQSGQLDALRFAMDDKLHQQ